MRAATAIEIEEDGAIPVPFSISTRTNATICRATKKKIVGGSNANNSSLSLLDSLVMELNLSYRFHGSVFLFGFDLLVSWFAGEFAFLLLHHRWTAWRQARQRRPGAQTGPPPARARRRGGSVCGWFAWLRPLCGYFILITAGIVQVPSIAAGRGE